MLPNHGHGLPAGGVPATVNVAQTIVVNAVATAQTAGMTLQNTTDAAAGAQQYSPMLVLEGQGWKTNATAASQKVEWAFQNRPVQAAANPTSVLDIMSQINAGGWTKPMTLTSAGLLTILGNFTMNTVVLTDSSASLQSGAGFVAAAGTGFKLSGNTGVVNSGGGLTYFNPQTNIGLLYTEQANGSTSDRWRVWHPGAASAGNLIAWGTGSTWTEIGHIDYLGNMARGATYTDIKEMTAPAAPAADTARLYADVSGVKTRLMVIFQTGAAVQIAIEP